MQIDDIRSVGWDQWLVSSPRARTCGPPGRPRLSDTGRPRWPGGRAMEKIGKYKVLGKIGEGAMGVVYKALDPLMERVVAVKTMAADLDSEPDLKTRFLREAKPAGQLSHKNIITIYDLFEEGGRIYIAMEFLDGEELKAKIARRERLPLEDKLRFMTELCEGLGHAHQKEIIHADQRAGDGHITRGGHVKILD